LSDLRQRLTAMMIVRNEANRYLQEVLTHLSSYADQIIILDDASTDDTPSICRSFPKVLLCQEEEPLFETDESLVRLKLWNYTIQANPDWILAIDADEIFEERFPYEVKDLINQDEFDAVEFRLFDLWGDPEHYRIDGGWNPWVKKVRMLFRYIPQQTYTWSRSKLHCGRVPLEVLKYPRVYQSDLRVKHYGWLRPEDINNKYTRYSKHDHSEHLQSVLAPPDQIKLEKWIAGKIIP
jgi:hypothetical protein